MQQARRVMCGASRRSREERQGRKAQVVWLAPARQRTKRTDSPVFTWCSHCVDMRPAGARGAGGSDENQSGRTWLMSMEGTHRHHAVARGRVLYFGNPKRGSSRLDPRPFVEDKPTGVRPQPASRTPTSETVGHLLAVLEGEAKAKKVGSRADPTTLEEERGKHLEDPPRQSAGQDQEGRVKKANDSQPRLCPAL